MSAIPDEARGGDCFKVTLAQAVLARDPSTMICHGIAVGRGPIEGVRYWHAWLERQHPAGFVQVIDRSNGHAVTLGQDRYYRLGQISHDEVWRFTAEEVGPMLGEWGHYGPWVCGWHAMTDEDDR